MRAHTYAKNTIDSPMYKANNGCRFLTLLRPVLNWASSSPSASHSEKGSAAFHYPVLQLRVLAALEEVAEDPHDERAHCCEAL